jgi:NAD(P)-dependent dehydrogenase (short-subunit alcohol dehydrogenase family)
MKRLAFVTGGNGGIGSAIVEKLLGQGCRVAYTYFEHEKDPHGLLAKHPGLEALHCNLLDVEEVDRVAEDVLSRYPSVDILVNNAGVMQDSLFLRMSRENWDNVIDVNLKSLFYFTRAFLPGMIKQKWGRVINISSVAGIRGYPGKTNYSASKAGIIGFTRSLAEEVASRGVTVNAITAGMIDTRMLAGIPEKTMAGILADIPAGRLGKPEEVAAVAAFLAGEESSYVTGEAITVSGGY